MASSLASNLGEGDRMELNKHSIPSVSEDIDRRVSITWITCLSLSVLMKELQNNRRAGTLSDFAKCRRRLFMIFDSEYCNDRIKWTMVSGKVSVWNIALFPFSIFACWKWSAKSSVTASPGQLWVPVKNMNKFEQVSKDNRQIHWTSSLVRLATWVNMTGTRTVSLSRMKTLRNLLATSDGGG